MIRNDSQMIQSNTVRQIDEDSSEGEKRSSLVRKSNPISQKSSGRPKRELKVAPPVMEKKQTDLDLEEIELVDEKPAPKPATTGSIWDVDKTSSQPSRPSAGNRMSHSSNPRSSNIEKPQAKVEVAEKFEPIEEKPKIKQETVQTFQMSDDEEKKIPEPKAPAQKADGFLDNLNSSFDEEDSEEDR